MVKREDIAEKDKWDLSSYFTSDEAWEECLSSLEKRLVELEGYKGKLGENAEVLAGYLSQKAVFLEDLDAVMVYARMKVSEDGAVTKYQIMNDKIESFLVKVTVGLVFEDAEVLAIPEREVKEWLARAEFADFRVYIRDILRRRRHILSEAEEKILGKFGEVTRGPEDVFSMWKDVDCKFDPVGGKPLTQGNYAVFLRSRDGAVREEAFLNHYAAFDRQKNTLATLYKNHLKVDKVEAETRRYSSSLAAQMFDYNVPEEVYRNLLEGVEKGLPIVHKYYALKKKKLGKLRHCDLCAPISKDGVGGKWSFDEGVEVILAALEPLGAEYVGDAREGLTTARWVDRYENEGKCSGAFSSGGYGRAPIILMNWAEGNYTDVSTLAHELGHSMHTLISYRAQPIMQAEYTLFEAEVASTTNEELLFKHVYNLADTREEKIWLLCERLDDMRVTIFLQAMFAEYEMLAHEMEERGEGVSLEGLRRVHRGLLEKYLGPSVELYEVSDLECLRVPHFYNSFYVFMYATSMCAAIDIARRAYDGEGVDGYMKFLSSGKSLPPAESLKLAGVDILSSDFVSSAVVEFSKLLSELERLLAEEEKA